MGINEGMTAGLALSLYSQVVSAHLQEKRVQQLEKKLVPEQMELLFPQDKVTLSSQSLTRGKSDNSTTPKTTYQLGSAQQKRIIDIYA